MGKPKEVQTISKTWDSGKDTAQTVTCPDPQATQCQGNLGAWVEIYGEDIVCAGFEANRSVRVRTGLDKNASQEANDNAIATYNPSAPRKRATSQKKIKNVNAVIVSLQALGIDTSKLSDEDIASIAKTL